MANIFKAGPAAAQMYDTVTAGDSLLSEALSKHLAAGLRQKAAREYPETITQPKEPFKPDFAYYKRQADEDTESVGFKAKMALQRASAKELGDLPAADRVKEGFVVMRNPKSKF